jgi:hypothetical protein
MDNDNVEIGAMADATIATRAVDVGARMTGFRTTQMFHCLLLVANVACVCVVK